MEAYHDLITFWAETGNDGFGGHTYSAPHKLKGRWENRQEEFYLPNSEIALSKAVIYIPAIKNIVYQVGSFVYNGVSPSTDPTILTGAFCVRQVLLIPDLRSCRNEIRFML